LRQALLADPASQAALRERNPQLAEALQNPEQFERIFNEQLSSRRSEAMRRMQLLSGNPFDPEVQRMIEQEIQQAEIESHMETAIEHMPETFAMVSMLYIRCLVNGHEVKAFVDSGAQATIMSEPCARRCNVTRLIDRRFAGIARGVGTSRILGRIHMAQLQIENDYLPTAFNVLEDAGVDMLFGLDMLKRHQCIIDLQRNMLVIGTTGTTTEFLPESELPGSDRAGGPTSPRGEDRQLSEALERSAAEAEAASLSAAVAASNVRRASPLPQEQSTGETANKTDGGTEQPASDSAASSSTGTSQENVNNLVSMGFRREDAIRELGKSGGDMNKAAMALIASSLPAPPPKKK